MGGWVCECMGGNLKESETERVNVHILHMVTLNWVMCEHLEDKFGVA